MIQPVVMGVSFAIVFFVLVNIGKVLFTRVRFGLFFLMPRILKEK